MCETKWKLMRLLNFANGLVSQDEWPSEWCSTHNTHGQFGFHNWEYQGWEHGQRGPMSRRCICLLQFWIPLQVSPSLQFSAFCRPTCLFDWTWMGNVTIWSWSSDFANTLLLSDYFFQKYYRAYDRKTWWMTSDIFEVCFTDSREGNKWKRGQLQYLPSSRLM